MLGGYVKLAILHLVRHRVAVKLIYFYISPTYTFDTLLKKMSDGENIILYRRALRRTIITKF